MEGWRKTYRAQIVNLFDKSDLYIFWHGIEVEAEGRKQFPIVFLPLSYRVHVFGGGGGGAVGGVGSGRPGLD